MTDATQETVTLAVPASFCKECNEPFLPIREHQIFCKSVCRETWHRRAQVRGGQAYEALMRWRLTRGKAKGIIAEIARIVDAWIAEDRKAGRMP